MPPPKDLLVEASLNLAWSHWVGLGVRGNALPPSSAVDPEALLYFTACLMEFDPRLRDEVQDWWSRFQRHISQPRLNALAERFDEPVVSKLKELERSISPAGKATTSGKSRLDHLGTPARALLRLRCAFGSNARADILLELLTRRSQPEYGLTALTLSEVGYSKRNVALILEELVLAGLLSATSEGNRIRYRLVDPAGMERVLRPIPTVPGRWYFRLPVLATFIELSRRLRGRDAVVQGIEARKTLERMRPLIAAAGATSPEPPAIAETYWAGLQRWLVEHLVGETAGPDREIPRMIEGVWAAPNEEPERPGRFSGAVLPRTSSNPLEETELCCLDLVQVPTVHPANDWIWAVLSTAATYTYLHTIGLNNRERWRFITWAFGERRVYSVEYDEPLPHDRISRLYGPLAASRARTDHPAVQLRLRRVAEH